MSSKRDSAVRPLFVAVGVVVLIAVLGLLWLRSINTLPAVHIPRPKMPSPNAYDYHLLAGKQLVDKRISFAIDDTPRKPDGDDRVYTLAEKEEIVRNNAQALAALREGFSYPCITPRPFLEGYLNFPMQREMARLLVLEGQVRAGHGDHGGAMNSYLDAVQAGGQIPGGGCVIHMLLGIAMQTIGRGWAWRDVQHLNASQCRSAVGRLKHIASAQVPYVEVLEEEKWSTRSELLNMLKKPDWLDTVASEYASGSFVPERFEGIQHRS